MSPGADRAERVSWLLRGSGQTHAREAGIPAGAAAARELSAAGYRRRCDESTATALGNGAGRGDQGLPRACPRPAAARHGAWPPSPAFRWRVISHLPITRQPIRRQKKVEDIMRLGSLILVIWLIIGLIATAQRGYFSNRVTCASAGTVVVTILAGPLNYVGVNPKLSCG